MLKIVILAGGYGTRLGDLTANKPKSMVEINNKPFIEWQLKLLSSKGVEQVVICTSYKSGILKDFVGNGDKFRLKVSYSEDGPTQLGTGGAIKKALPLLEDKFMVLYGDSYLDIDYLEVGRAFEKSKKPALMTVFRNEGFFDASNVLFEENMVKSYSKKKIISDFNFIDFGLSVFSKEVFYKDKYEDIFDLSTLFESLASSGNLAGFESKKRFYEIGSMEGIEDFVSYVKEREHEF